MLRNRFVMDVKFAAWVFPHWQTCSHCLFAKGQESYEEVCEANERASANSALYIKRPFGNLVKPYTFDGTLSGNLVTLRLIVRDIIVLRLHTLKLEYSSIQQLQ